jgi:hypothetical protein
MILGFAALPVTHVSNSDQQIVADTPQLPKMATRRALAATEPPGRGFQRTDDEKLHEPRKLLKHTFEKSHWIL